MRLRIDNDVIAYQIHPTHYRRGAHDDAKPNGTTPPGADQTIHRRADPRHHKAFDQNMQCRGFSVRVGQTYNDRPGQGLRKWLPRLAKPARRVEMLPARQPVCGGRDGRDFSRRTKTPRSPPALKINAEIALPQIISDGVAYLMGLCKDAFALKPGEDASGYDSQLAASGCDGSDAASGCSSKLAASGCGSKLAASGYGSQLAASGNDSQLAASG